MFACLFKKEMHFLLKNGYFFFFFRKVIATFSVTEILAKSFLSLAAKNIDFVLSAHDGV